MSRSLLIVEPEEAARRQLVTEFQALGFSVEEAGAIDVAETLLARSAFDAILCDYPCSRAVGHELLRRVLSHPNNTLFLFMANPASIEDSVDAIKSGADDYLVKPVSPEAVAQRIEETPARGGRPGSLRPDRAPAGNHHELDDIVGRSADMQNIYRIIELVAPTSSTVLITGESGTGKEMVARAIHARSARRTHPILSVNCGAIPESLLEDELFGHVKGAFTGAHQSRPGFFESADHGTLFLDEITTLPLELQSKLLRVLQEREIRPLGSDQARSIDVRIIAAADDELRRLVDEGHFREDLYYRLNVIPIRVPSLRERKEDIPALVQHFLTKVRIQHALPEKNVSRHALRRLLAYDWPGNIRQLENAIEMACILSGNRATLQPEDFEETLSIRVAELQNIPELEIPKEGLDLNQFLERMERKLIEKTLLVTEGNKNRAAHLLGLKRTTLVEKLKRWEKIEAPR